MKENEVTNKIQEMMDAMGAKVIPHALVDEDSRVPGGSRFTAKQRKHRKVRNNMAKRSRRINRGS